MPEGSRIADVAITEDGRIHAWVIGDGDEPVRVYDPASDQWSLDSPVALPGPIPFEGQLVDGWGYGDETEVAAGGDGLIYMSWGVAGPEFRLFAYDPATRMWERDAAVVFDEFVFDMATGSDGDIYLLAEGHVLHFDVETRTLADRAPRDAPFQWLSRSGDHAFTAFTSANGSTVEGPQFATYDAEADAWDTPQPLPVLDSGSWSADLDGWLYGVQHEPDTLAVARDPATGEWVPLAAPPAPLGPESFVADGRLYAIGSGVATAVFVRE